MGKVVEKKIRPKFFEQVLSGEKTYELRLADFDIAKGDTLVLREWDPRPNVPRQNDTLGVGLAFGTGGQTPKGYTGRSIEKKVTLVVKTKGDDFHNHTPEEIEKYGWQVIGIE